MIVDRYYYQLLNKQEKAIYKAFYSGAMAHQDIIPIPVRGEFSRESYERIFMAMTRDNPLIYYLNQSACSIAKDSLGRIAICPQYFFAKEKVKEYNRKIEKVVNGLVEQLQLLKCDDYEKELRIHDWICRNVEYDLEGSNINQVSRVIVSHNIIGVFAHHKAQCEGIAKAVKVLLNTVDVKCIVATGNAIRNGENTPHAWNVVNIDGKPYQLDVTWDLGSAGNSTGFVSHEYFNLTDDLTKQEHNADHTLPKCSSKADNYYVRQKCSFQMHHRLMAYVDKMLAQKRDSFEFRVEGRLNKTGIEVEVSDYILKKVREQGKNARIRIHPNRSLGIFRIEIIENGKQSEWS